jgi:outer membrane lipoprotein LolB
MPRALRLLLLSALLAGCAAPPRVPADAAALRAQAERETALRAVPGWGLAGRIAVSNGRDGGSGAIDWTQVGDGLRLEVQAPVTRQTWRLDAGPGWARIEGLEAGPLEGEDAARLVADAVGWTLPVGDLGAWVRGVRGRGPAEIEFSPDGLPARIRQHGWTVDYREWDRTQSPPLPRRVFAERGDQRVRLVIQAWRGPTLP